MHYEVLLAFYYFYYGFWQKVNSSIKYFEQFNYFESKMFFSKLTKSFIYAFMYLFCCQWVEYTFQTAFCYLLNQLYPSIQRRKLLRATVLKIELQVESGLKDIGYFLFTRKYNCFI